MVTVNVDGDQTLVVACSDGAGSASHSHIGSQRACDSIVQSVTEYLTAGAKISAISREIAMAWYGEAQAKIYAEAKQLEVAPRELACTMLLAIIGAEDAIFSQVGDGAIVVHPPDSFRAVFWPQSGEYANTTNFITGATLADDLDFEQHSGRIESIAVFTDGLERLILRFQDRAVHAPFLTQLFSQLRNSTDSELLFGRLRTFLESGAVNERTDDDKTLILASRAKSA